MVFRRAMMSAARPGRGGMSSALASSFSKRWLSCNTSAHSWLDRAASTTSGFSGSGSVIRCCLRLVLSMAVHLLLPVFVVGSFLELGARAKHSCHDRALGQLQGFGDFADGHAHQDLKHQRLTIFWFKPHDLVAKTCFLQTLVGRFVVLFQPDHIVEADQRGHFALESSRVLTP